MKQFLLLIFALPNLLLAQKQINHIQQKQITQNSFQLCWESSWAGKAAVQYGLTPNLEIGVQEASPTKNASNYQVTLHHLQAATFYYVRPFVTNGTDTIWGATGYYSTQSNSTGVIHVMFNQGIDPLYSNGSIPYINSGGSNIENEIISRINQATTSIDIAVYNNTRSAIVTALNNAQSNGVQVRYIANSGAITSNAALNNSTLAFPVFYANTADLMHNKFMVIDAHSVNNSWVWTGSCNWTYTDMYTNYNNSVLIQDQALAQAYILEFEEMWGSNTASYNASNSKVGAQKLNNTPHTFNIGGRLVEAYFSPSDNTTNEIESSLYSADNDIEFCLLSYTRNELGTAIRNEHQSGTLEHGIMENINDPGSEYNWLTGQGVNLLADNHSTMLHHKYAVVDAGNINSDPLVITGSHNWTTAAEERNDENTLIIHDADIANLYLQEFTARWCEVKNNVNCSLPFSVFSNTKRVERVEEAIQIYPNPTTGSISIEIEEGTDERVEAKLYSPTGQLLQRAILGNQYGTYFWEIDVDKNGIYFLSIQSKTKIWKKSIHVIR
ncbi:phospholipase D-like domain-containing protein [Aureispira sp. CCB-QB1]|uniref:phospholipase D-like domain-containing protein n=1 Tax=Aureispira sp. CCB-QB1 TaxID=1313421 RepID=UPI00069859FD|nr:phospholipase D-like domain-containing protein [Aureispira sp. CCB-QB1]